MRGLNFAWNKNEKPHPMGDSIVAYKLNYNSHCVWSWQKGHNRPYPLELLLGIWNARSKLRREPFSAIANHITHLKIKYIKINRTKERDIPDEVSVFPVLELLWEDELDHLGSNQVSETVTPIQGPETVGEGWKPIIKQCWGTGNKRKRRQIIWIWSHNHWQTCFEHSLNSPVISLQRCW